MTEATPQIDLDKMEADTAYLETALPGIVSRHRALIARCREAEAKHGSTVECVNQLGDDIRNLALEDAANLVIAGAPWCEHRPDGCSECVAGAIRNLKEKT